MKIKVNDTSYECSEGTTVAGLLKELNLASTGVAVAVNDSIITKSQWRQQVLLPRDLVHIIHATAGG